MNICILGGCGYIGTVLTNNFLNAGHNVKVIDLQWFGNKLNNKKNLKIVKKSILFLEKKDFKNTEIIIHLANVANDPTVELNPELSWNINVLASMKICELASEAGVKKIIFSSSGSVYGVKKEKKVTEQLSLKPISVYNKTKMVAERVFLSYKDKIDIFIIRPATVCGYSPRLRLDISINLLTYQAFENKKIIVHGGKQIRPNIHINDLCRIFEFFSEKKNIEPGIYNAGFENMSILSIANKIKEKIACELLIKKIIDIRSYRLNSDKLLKVGFKPLFNIDNAINELVYFFNNNKFKSSINNFNVKKMNKLKL